MASSQTEQRGGGGGGGGGGEDGRRYTGPKCGTPWRHRTENDGIETSAGSRAAASRSIGGVGRGPRAGTRWL